jgi:GGDEF domain-containing protein
MRIFDRIDALYLNRRQWQLCLLALAVIVILIVGMALLVYPTAFSNDLIVSGATKRKLFFGFCALSVLLVGYFLDRQMVINQLRRWLAEEHRQAVEIRHEASMDLLATLPRFELFRDRLAMEYRRATSTHLPLSLLFVRLKPSPHLSDKDAIDAAFGDAARSLTRKLRGEDSIYHFPPGVFGIVLPGVGAENARSISKRLTEGLHNASGASTRFLFDVRVINYPEHASTAREMEEAARSLFPVECLEAQIVEAG